jgi:Tfp pilus assembly protein PilN
MNKEELNNEIGQLSARRQKRVNDLQAIDPLLCQINGAMQAFQAVLEKIPDEAIESEPAPVPENKSHK